MGKRKGSEVVPAEPAIEAEVEFDGPPEKLGADRPREVWPIDRCRPYGRNARRHSPEQIEKLKGSLVAFGWTRPVLVMPDGMVVAGHGCLEAARRLGLRHVPVIILNGLSDAEARAYVLADNRLALDATWDLEILQAELDALRGDEFPLEVMGFGADELSALGGKGGDPDKAPPVPVVPVSRTGDRWCLGEHRLVCGDATSRADLELLLDFNAAGCVWTDPPYNVAYKAKAGSIANDDLPASEFEALLRGAFHRMFDFLEPGSPVYVAHADTAGLVFRAEFERAGFKLSGCLVWRKNALVLGRSDYQWQHEPILYGWKPGGRHPWFGGRKNTTMLESPGGPVVQTGPGEFQIETASGSVVVVRGEAVAFEEEFGTVIEVDKPAANPDHPTMKPTALIERMLRCSSKPGTVVLDPFGGSGSTLMACEVLGRKARLLELSPAYCDVIVRRWQGFSSRAATLVTPEGPTFEAVALERGVDVEAPNAA